MDRERVRTTLEDLDRRRVGYAVGGVVLAVALVALATGNLAFLLTLEAKTFTAEPATVDPAVLNETGYEPVEGDGVTGETVTRRIGPLNAHRVRVENRITQYRLNVRVPRVDAEVPVGAFVAVSSPKARALGAPRNPLRRGDTDDLLDRVEDQYGAFEVDEKVDERELEVLGTETTVEEYDGSTSVLGLFRIGVDVQITVVPHEGDFVVVAGIYPDFLPGEREVIFAMMRALEHG